MNNFANSNDQFKNKALWIMGASLLVHVLSAYLTDGFYHFDEHYQIIEFANVKFNHLSTQDLPWEYQYALRPWLLPSFFWLIEFLFGFVKVTNPFFLVSVLKVFSGLLGFVCSNLLFKMFESEFSAAKEKLTLLLFLHFTWFVPFLQIHSSSESFAASFFIIGLFFFFKNNNLKSQLLSGVFFGLAFESRFQSAFMILAVYVWFLYQNRKITGSLIFNSLGFIFMFICGRILDFWGYDKMSFSPWNYFYENIINKVGNQWGVEPVWYYFSESLKTTPPLGLLFLALLIYALYKHPKYILSWVVLFFLIPHSLIAHKEFRFIFPILTLSIPLVYKVIADLKINFTSIKTKLILTLNILFFIFLTFFNSRREFSLLKELYQNQNQEKLPYAVYGADPCLPTQYKMNFYCPNYEKITEDISHHTEKFWLIVRDYSKYEIPQFCKKVFDDTPYWQQTETGSKLAIKAKVKSQQLYICNK